MGDVIYALGICGGLLYIGYRIFHQHPNKTFVKGRWFEITDDQRN